MSETRNFSELSCVEEDSNNKSRLKLILKLLIFVSALRNYEPQRARQGFHAHYVADNVTNFPPFYCENFHYRRVYISQIIHNCFIMYTF